MSSERSSIRVRGARQNNLRSIDVDIPHDRLTVLTGVSGSGKSSLAFDVIFREARRRYLESFSPAARLAMGKIERPDVDHIEGLRPAIAVAQRTTIAGPRSTVGTLSGLSDILRLLLARLGRAPEGFPLKIERSLFSFNSARGACPSCRGLGVEDRIDPALLIADPNKSLRQGALALTTPSGYIIYSQVTMDVLDIVCRAHGFDVDRPWRDLGEDERRVVLFGSEKVRIPFGKHPLESRLRWKGITARPRQEAFYKGILPTMEAILQGKRNDGILRYARTFPCRACGGRRLRPEALAVTFAGRSIADWTGLTMAGLREAIDGAPFEPARAAAGEALRRAIVERANICLRLGLGHLTLDRSSDSLSGGEAQRIRLAVQAGSRLRGVLYVLDEPTAGLHPEETACLIEVLRDLCDGGNTVLVVEHDEDVVGAADHVIELGPGPGPAGGTIVYTGPPKPPPYQAPAAPPVRTASGRLVIRGARLRNLRLVTAEFLTGALNVVCGPAGSGKKTLVRDVLAARLRSRAFGPGPDADGLDAAGSSPKLIQVDQSPIGRTPRSNPATYTGLADRIRDLFAASPEAVSRGFGKGRFSFNTPGGRCEQCLGAGYESVGMHFLGDVDVPCPVCETRRFNAATLAVKVRGKDIHDVLDLTVEEAAGFFTGDKRLADGLGWLHRLGLSYLKLGQSSSTLSGGEAQRVRLASELMRPVAAGTVFLLEEPTTGLHRRDINDLLVALDGLVQKGHTVVAVENDPWFLKSADRLIELGPGAGPEGGNLVFSGSPNQAVDRPESAAGRSLRRLRQIRTGAPPGSAPARRRDAMSPIEIRGATTHNLRSIDVDIPYERLTVVAGPSGSGKSSLAFDTLQAEARRLFLDGFSSYVRDRLDVGAKAGLESAAGLTPPLAIGPRTAGRHPRSTVGTMSEIVDYVRLLYSRSGRDAEGGEPSGLSAAHFSFNTEEGACPRCRGLGILAIADTDKLITDPGLPLTRGAMDGSKSGRFYGEPDGRHVAALKAAGAAVGIDFDVPFRDLGPEARKLAFQGTGDRLYDIVWSYKRGRRTGDYRFRGPWPGLAALVEEEYARKHADERGEALRALLRDSPCPDCGGGRLRPEAMGVTFLGLTLPALTALSADEAERRLSDLSALEALGPKARSAAEVLLPEIVRRLGLIRQVSLGYLSLDRRAETLSGGEHQRLRLASLWGSRLSGVTYILDEPTRGLHARDTARLLGALQGLLREGNTVVVVEHDLDIVTAADHVLELGPGAGSDGGRVVASGPPAEIAAKAATATGRALRSLRIRPDPLRACLSNRPGLAIREARANNLRGIDAEFPSGALTVVSGVSGSGKTSLVRDVLLRSARAGAPVGCRAIEGLSLFARVISVDQRLPALSPRATAATRLHLLDPLRDLFAATAEAKRRGFGKAHFSHLTAAGRCPECEGSGVVGAGLDFLADVETTCPACGGARYQPEILEVRLLGRTIAEALALPFAEVGAVFGEHPALRRASEAMQEAGLGYLELGRRLDTLADGEAQRLKLAEALLEPVEGEALFLFDEPTAGLQAEEVSGLAAIFQKLLVKGHTLICVEHDLDIIARAHRVIDLGPEGGQEGGRVVAAGTPAELAGRSDSATGTALRLRFGL